MKPKITKQGDCWQLARPGYGFSPPEVTEHATWREARARLLGTAVGSAGAQLERAAAPPALRYGPPHGQIRLGEDQ